eukprot:2445479-Heterocapsa_arctica.AAC.1
MSPRTCFAKPASLSPPRDPWCACSISKAAGYVACMQDYPTSLPTMPSGAIAVAQSLCAVERSASQAH